MELSRRELNEAATATFDFTLARLKAAPGVEACADVARHVAAEIEGKFAALERDGAGIACVAGCAFCCHQRVGLLPHEAIALLQHLRSALPPAIAENVESRIRANAARSEGLAPREHLALRQPCAFLVDGRCSAYAVRPANCAAYHSLSRARCEHAFANPQDAGTPRNSRPALLALQTFCDAQIDAMRAGVAAAGFDDTKGELNASLRTLLDDPDALPRWLAGGKLDAA
jgi:Fe-S-cluster containining protein